MIKLFLLALGIGGAIFSALILRLLLHEFSADGLFPQAFFGAGSAILLFTMLSNVKSIRIDFDKRVIVLKNFWVISSCYGFEEFTGYKPFTFFNKVGVYPAFFIETATGVRATFSGFELFNYDEVRKAISEALVCDENLQRNEWHTGNQKTMGLTVVLLAIIYAAVLRR